MHAPICVKTHTHTNTHTHTLADRCFRHDIDEKVSKYEILITLIQ